MDGSGVFTLRHSGGAALRVAMVLASVLLALFGWAASAHALSITEAGYTVPVAYELKSLQVTHFYCQVDTPGVWATLRIRDGQGRVVRTIYSGPIQNANTRFWFPGWNGTDNNGQRLFSASWNWELEVNKGGAVTKRTGKITVSKIQFFMKGNVWDIESKYDIYSRYMIPGNANMYVRVVSADPPDAFGIGIMAPNGKEWSYTYNVSGSPTNYTTYLRGGESVVDRGMHQFLMLGAFDVYYYITVIQ